MAGSSAQLATSCIELADRIRPPLLHFYTTACTQVPQVLRYNAQGFPGETLGPRAPSARSLGSPASQSSSRLQTLVFFLNPHPHPSVARPTQGSRSLPSRPEFPACLASSHPSTSSAPAFACLDRFSFDVNRIGTRLFLMNLSFLFF